jgi:hypothetical protein
VSTIVTVTLLFESDDRIMVGAAAGPVIAAAVDTGALSHVHVGDYDNDDELVDGE